jgi:hypothetical protein
VTAITPVPILSISSLMRSSAFVASAWISRSSNFQVAVDVSRVRHAVEAALFLPPHPRMRPSRCMLPCLGKIYNRWLVRVVRIQQELQANEVHDDAVAVGGLAESNLAGRRMNPLSAGVVSSDLPFPGLCVCAFDSTLLSSHQRIFFCPSKTSLARLSSRSTPTAAASRSPNLAPGRRAMPLY